MLTVAACQNLLTSTEEILLMDEYKVIGLDNTGRRSLSDVWINTALFCEGAPGTDVTCAKQLDDIQRKLNTLNPVPVPQPGAALPLPAADATVLYRRFVDTHQGSLYWPFFSSFTPASCSTNTASSMVRTTP